MKFLAPLVLLSLMLSACGSEHFGRPENAAPTPIISSYTIERDLIFSPPDWPQQLLLDVYVPEGNGPFPSVLLIHGGAWKRGGRGQVTSLAERIASRGYLVVNTTYRLVPEYIYPAQLHDVQLAARWMISQGMSYGVDPMRMAAYGYSAGAHLGALLVHSADTPELGDQAQKFKALVAGGTPADLTLYESGYLVPNFIGGPKEEKFETYRQASPITHVSPNDPPVFQYHATLDRYVPFEQAKHYRDALDNAGISNELFVIRGHGHISAFFADGDAVEASLTFLDRYLR